MSVLPDWASRKEIEGMQEFLEIVNEYGRFDVDFSPATFDEEVGFHADVKWNPAGRGERVVQFNVQWNYDQFFAADNKEYDCWQFVFGESAFELTSQLFYMELFQRVDDQLFIENDH